MSIPVNPTLAGEGLRDDSGELVALLDDPDEWDSFGRPLGAGARVLPAGAPVREEGAVWESQVVLEGMHCTACALTIEDVISSVPGVLRVDVSAATQRARVFWQPSQVRPSQWMGSVRAAGYRALPATDHFVRGQRLKETRNMMWRVAVAGFCMMQVMMYATPTYGGMFGNDLTRESENLLRWASWVLSLPVVVFCCGPFFGNALRDLRQRTISMDLPVALGMAITFVVSMAGTFDPDGIFGQEVYYDSLTMFVFFLLTGRWMELRLRDRTAGALESLMNRLPQSVEVRQADGSFRRMVARRVRPGDVVRVLPGEAFPADGRIAQGQTLAAEALLTGESQPVKKPEGSEVVAGSYNLQSAVLVEAVRVGADTRYAQIVSLMENAALQKPRLAQLADRIAKPFLLAVLVAGFLAAAWWWPQGHGKALMVAVSVFVVTCPCALSLATPAAMLASAGALARQAVMVRNLQAFEPLAHADVFVFDKTGTLTSDRMKVTGGQPCGDFMGQEAALRLAALVCSHSLHPVSRALVQAVAELPPAGDDAPRWRILSVREDVGHGLSARVEMDDPAQTLDVRVGSARYCGLDAQGLPEDGIQRVWMAEDARGLLAEFCLEEELRDDAAQVIQALQQQGVAVGLLSGDRPQAVQRIAARLGIDQARGGCTPAEKLDIMRERQAGGHCVAMVGDGMNDGPVIAGADVSFAFGSAVPLAQARADFVVPGACLMRIVQTAAVAKRTMRVVRQNLLWAAVYNAASVPLAIAGLMPPWLAGLGMAASSLLVVVNAARLARPS